MDGSEEWFESENIIISPLFRATIIFIQLRKPIDCRRPHRTGFGPYSQKSRFDRYIPAASVILGLCSECRKNCKSCGCPLHRSRGGRQREDIRNRSQRYLSPAIHSSLGGSCDRSGTTRPGLCHGTIRILHYQDAAFPGRVPNDCDRRCRGIQAMSQLMDQAGSCFPGFGYLTGGSQFRSVLN